MTHSREAEQDAGCFYSIQALVSEKGWQPTGRLATYCPSEEKAGNQQAGWQPTALEAGREVPEEPAGHVQ